MNRSSSSGEPTLYRPCVGAMLVNDRGLVWIGRRNDGDEYIPESSRWQMPQGGIDEGEDPRDAVLREVFEETNATSLAILAETADWLTYDLPRQLMGIAWKGRYRGQQQKWFLIRFSGRDSEFDIAHPGGGLHEPEFDAWKWTDISRLGELVVAFKRPVYEAVVAEFSPLVAAIAAGSPPRLLPARGG